MSDGSILVYLKPASVSGEFHLVWFKKMPNTSGSTEGFLVMFGTGDIPNKNYKLSGF
jgi:hypothetical protein